MCVTTYSFLLTVTALPTEMPEVGIGARYELVPRSVLSPVAADPTFTFRVSVGFAAGEVVAPASLPTAALGGELVRLSSRRCALSCRRTASRAARERGVSGTSSVAAPPASTAASSLPFASSSWILSASTCASSAAMRPLASIGTGPSIARHASMTRLADAWLRLYCTARSKGVNVASAI